MPLRAFATVVVLAACACMPVLPGSDPDLTGQQVRLTLLHTSDIHSRLVPFDFAPLKADTDLGLIPEAAPFGGATRLAALLKRERANSGRALHLDSGDCFQGAPIFNENNGEVEFKFLSEVRLDAAVIGNHEFDAGARNFTEKARDFARFPLLAANYVWEDHRQLGSNQTAKYTAPYEIRVLEGLRVAIIGMANISSLNSIVEGGNSLQVTPLEQNEIARGYVELLRPVTDLVVVVSHLGLHEDQDLIRGYDAYFEYGRARSFISRAKEPWQILEWFGPEGDDKSVVHVQIPGVSGIDVVLGGHLHVVLNPPQILTDPSGRPVVLAHSGAFAKYLGRLDVVVQMPGADGHPEGGEVVSHEFRVFPIDSLWCSDAARAFYKSRFWDPGEFRRDPLVIETIAECQRQEDPRTTQLMLPYVIGLDFSLSLSSIFAYAPRDIARRNYSTGGDAPLGNMTADSMRKRRRVEAEVALTNTLGIRDNLYAGPITEESMFNVFPFENTINIMYLSGVEMEELFDFVTERSAGRGCQAQAQISGASFTMDCAQAQLNDLRYPCATEKNGADCPQENREGRNPWMCLHDLNGGRCWAHPALGIRINGKALDKNGTYKIAVNDYIAKGGSGFSVLKRNTTRIETGISLRDSLIGYMHSFCNCEEINAGKEFNRSGEPCGNLVDGKWVVDDQAKAYCRDAATFKTALEQTVDVGGRTSTCVDLLRSGTCRDVGGGTLGAACATCTAQPGPNAGRCSCLAAVQNDEVACGHVTAQLRAFCSNPMPTGVAVGVEDGRIGRRVK